MRLIDQLFSFFHCWKSAANIIYLTQSVRFSRFSHWHCVLYKFTYLLFLLNLQCHFYYW